MLVVLERGTRSKMQLRLYDLQEPSINPSFLLSTTGVSTAAVNTGGGQVLTGSTTTPGLAVPTAEPIYRIVSDITTGTPAAAGVALIQQYNSTNTGGAQFGIPGTIALNTAKAAARFSYGVVVAAPGVYAGPATASVQQNVGGQSMICVEGMVNAFVAVSSAITYGTGLAVGAVTKTLTDSTATVPGGIWALAMGGTTATSSTSLLVKVGGY